MDSAAESSINPLLRPVPPAAADGDDPSHSRGFSFFGGDAAKKRSRPPIQPSLKLSTDRDVYRPGDPVVVTVEVCNKNLGFGECSYLIDKLSCEVKGIEKSDTQWFTAQPDSKQRRGEYIFMDCLATCIASNQIVSSGTTKTYLVRSLLPSIIPPSYRGATIRYLYYVRCTLSGQYLISENGHSLGESTKDVTELEARIPLQIWVTQENNGLSIEDGHSDGIVPASTVLLDVFWKETDADSDWARANDAYDGVEEGYESSRDVISSVSSYNPAKGSLHRAFGRVPPAVADGDDPSQVVSRIAPVIEKHESSCWGCGSLLILASYSPVFKCGWCGAITNQNVIKRDNNGYWWRHLRDRCFVSVLMIFMFFMIGGGLWAIYPIVFSISKFCGVFHCTIAAILAVTTICSFSQAAFCSAGAPPMIIWGSYAVVGKGGLENYTFCHYCSKPKSPRTHHCRACQMCVLDMDHHCPFIGNCVGASNHRSFILFLISAIIGMLYLSGMTVYAGYHIWPPLKYRAIYRLHGTSNGLAWNAMKETLLAFMSSAVFLSPRGLILVYLFVASFSVKIGLIVLLWQQLCYIYEGNTYLGHLNSQGGGDAEGEKDCQNFVRFFGCPTMTTKLWNLPRFRCPKKKHTK